MQPAYSGHAHTSVTFHVEKEAEDPLSKLKQPEEISLSRYFPKGSIYFYAFPAGEESGFFNGIEPWIEELVAARPLLCAGPNLRVLSFAPSIDHGCRALLEELGGEMLDQERVIALPKTISFKVKGAQRNVLIKESLTQIATKRELIMAQPYTDEHLRNAFQINPEISVYLNDKKNMEDYIPLEHLPKEYARFESGQQFAATQETFFLPCVVKVSSSSAGDGVRICRTEEDIQKAKQDFIALKGIIIVYQFVESISNCCIQFGIPFDTQKDIEIIGFNEQFIGKCGEFLGGLVPVSQFKAELVPVYEAMLTKILPKVRAMGWYGVGGLDVLLTKSGEFYFIDPNFRMTATFAFVNQVRNGKIKKSLLGFTGSFKGTEAEFREKITPIARLGTENQLLDMASLTYQEGVYRFNGAVVFGGNEGPEVVGKKLLDLGIQSSTLMCLTA